MRIPTLFLGALLATGSSLTAQRGALETKPFEDAAAGYRLKTPKEWNVIPVAPDARASGLAFQADPPDAKSPVAGRFRVVVVATPEEFAEWSQGVLEEVSHEAPELASEKPALEETLEIGGLMTTHRRWLAGKVHVDTWLFARASDRIGVIGTVGEEDKYASSWLSTFERSAMSLVHFPPITYAEGAGTTYTEKLAAASAEAERTPGWRVEPTPSQKFIITTSCENKGFVEEVIDRLERSRLVFEDDYPPPHDFEHVSIVRVCGSDEEFHRYGKTGGGVMGWFNPESTELVLYDAKEIDRNMSFAVITHEAFHQYCHFLFGRSEAHRWFDEGHGDYYGGMKFSASGKPKVTARMPGGLERLSGIREMIQAGTYAPLEKHLNFTHPEWQGQGGGGTMGYEQSWSIIFMLRQGMLGNVNPKVWRKEYASILPNYISTLRKGFDAAYAAELAKRSLASGADPNSTTSVQIELDSDDLGEETVRRIWKEAMGASFGQVDLAQFEEDWKLYVKKYLKD